MASAEQNGHTIYDIATGKVRNTPLGGRRFAELNCKVGEAIVEGQWNDIVWYFPGGERTARPKVFDRERVEIVADGIDLLAVHDVPAGTEITMDRVTDVVDDGVWEFVTAIPGRYVLDVEPPFPFQIQRVEIIANAP